MDNLTHTLIGLNAAKAGLEKLSPGTTTLCILAANAPDADILAGIFGGRWSYLQHHRGITHSIVGTITLAVALPLIFYLVDLLTSRIRHQAPSVKLKGLLLASLIVSATHPLVDWTNNYGIRFLLPWNSRWFYGDFVFIIDPFIWLMLGGSAFLVMSKTNRQILFWLIISLVPTYLILFGPASRGGLSNPTLIRILWIIGLVVLVFLFTKGLGKRWDAKVPVAAFTVLTCYLVALMLIHVVALRQARFEAANIAAENSESAVDVAAMPTVANPFKWLCVVETERAAYRFELALLGNHRNQSNVVRHEKPEALKSPAIAQALLDSRTRIFMNFARFPVAQVEGEDCATQTLVQFADLRYTEPGQDRGTFSLEVPVDCPLLDKE
jgi:inner membrane protein